MDNASLGLELTNLIYTTMFAPSRPWGIIPLAPVLAITVMRMPYSYYVFVRVKIFELPLIKVPTYRYQISQAQFQNNC